MRPEPEPIPSGEMLRANTAVALVLIAVLALAMIAVMAGLRASRDQSRAEEAETASRDRLWNAYLEESRAVRISGEAGRRTTALNVIRSAAAYRATPTLRTEAVASLVLSDLTQESPLVLTPPDLLSRNLDATFRHYAYGDYHGTVHVGDLVTRQPLFELQARDVGAGTGMGVRDVLFSPDGRNIAARFTGGAVVVWDLATKAVLMSADANATNYQLSNLAFSSDSKHIIFADPEMQGQVVVYDIATGRPLTVGVSVGYSFFKLRPDGGQVAVVAEGGVKLIDFPGGTNTQLLAHNVRVGVLAWSPDGSRLATSCEDGDVYIWDLARGTHRILRGHSERCVNLGFSRDSTQFFSSSRDGTTRLWDVEQGQTVAVGEGIAELFSADGNHLGFWRTFTGFGVWTVSHSADYRLLSCPRSEGPLLTLDLSPSGKWCVATQNKGFRVWNLNDNDSESYVSLPQFYCAHVSVDEKSLFICRSNGLESWPLTNYSGRELQLKQSAAKSIPLPDSLGARAIALNGDGRLATVELTDRRLVVLDLTGKNPPVELQGRWRNVNFKGPASLTGAGRFAMSPDGRWVLTGYDFGGNDVPRVWDARSGALVTNLDAETSVVAFSPDGRWLSLAGTSRYSLWSVGDWSLRGRFDRDEPSITHGTMAFGENGLLAVATTRKNIQLQPAPGEPKLLDLISPSSQSINSIRLAYDDSVLVTATASDMVQVWRLGHLRQELADLQLDWDSSAPRQSVQAAVKKTAPSLGSPRATLAFSLTGMLLAGFFAFVILRQHRASIARFISAEARTAQRNQELEMAKLELMHSQKMQALGTLAAGIAHDFNNLLSVIRMSNKLVGRTSKDPEIQEHVADIEQAAVQGKNVVRSMLGYARNESAQSRPTNVNEVVDSTVSLLNKEFLSRIQLVLELSAETQPVAINQGRLEQILLNLIVNASEAMQGQGRLKISARLRTGNQDGFGVLAPRPSPVYVELRVGDSGPGIPREILSRIFEPFFSTKLAASTPGTGLGLSLVYSISQQDGLGLRVESVHGNGAVFSLLIPVADNSAKA